MADSSSMEAQESKLNLVNDDPEAVDAMINYLYHFDYACSITTPLVLHVRVLAIADKYFIERLKKLAADRFTECCKSEWSTAAFAEAVSEIYSTGLVHDLTLRCTVVNTIKENAAELRLANPEHSALKDVLLTTSELGAELFFDGIVGAMTAESKTDASDGYGTWYRCPGDGCSEYGIAFSVQSSHLPDEHAFYCPGGCSDEDKDWWSQYRIDPPV
ncbi:hypothetical protein LTR36_004010 [Oleoguttula mirabilis]|uniref:BTB domain-containing protein n=1 Tax=Oleoguttula mirabilis TaxID=1507867 RepID=A0AAV9JIR2_9PEZI|nr:hypothetical protein LTR36_004010 [Oleoguttula mirabilis]